MFTVKDCVSQTTTTTGTDDFVLAARAGFLRFSDAFIGNPFFFVYEAHAVDGAGLRTGDFETGIGQFFNDAGVHKIRRLRKLSGSDPVPSGEETTLPLLDFGVGTKIVSLVVGAAQVEGLRIGRDQAGEPVTLYVRTDGSNGNSGLINTADGAFRSLDHAMGEALAYYAGAKIMVGPGSFSAGIANDPGKVTIIGAGSASTTIGGVYVQAGQECVVSNCRVVSAGGVGLSASGTGALIVAYDIEFGACDYAHALAGLGGTVDLDNYSVSGGSGAHLRAEPFGRIVCRGPATLLDNFALTDGWVVCNKGLGYVDYDGGVIDLAGHTVTGKRYDIRAGSVCNTYGGGESFLPGSVAGTTASGGQYL